MDWSKSKSIFIVVFLILDVFLYSLYLNRHTEAQQVREVSIGEQNIEARLKNDHITYGILPTGVEKAAFIRGKVKNFKEENLEIENAQKVITDKNKLVVTLNSPVGIKNIEDAASYNDFLTKNVYMGTSYTLWEINKEKKSATFFQTVNSSTLYYILNGLVTVYWNDQNEIVRYEQTLLELENIEDEKEKVLTTPLRAIQTLYNKGLLLPNSEITKVNLGYTTMVQFTETQIFVPTWEIRVKTEKIEEEYFINAVEGGILDLSLDASRVEEVEEAITENRDIELDEEIQKK